MEPSNKLLSDIIHYRTYAKYLPIQERREIFPETVNRVMQMHLERFPKLSKEIVKAFQKVHELKVMPSMRTMQFAGPAILKNNLRSYNCSAVAITYPRVFAEILFLLLSGCGVGFSVQQHHVSQLPVVRPPAEEGRYVVHDSIAGWADALDRLCSAYFYGAIRPIFDFTQVRTKGSYLSTTGAKAPGPEPLKHMLSVVEGIFRTSLGRRMRTLEIHDLVCIVSDCVISGGIRRSALISLFDRDDRSMLTCKHGDWWTKHPYRARANNSAVLPLDEVTKDEFFSIYRTCAESGSGEPGFSWTSSPDWLTNPCHEIALQSQQLCNLTIVNQTDVTSKKDFLSRIYSATLIGTLQASYTNFPFVSEGWRKTTESEALLGVSFTGIADSSSMISDEWLREGATLACDVNDRYSRIIGINPAARVTTLKPEGTSSCLLGSSSGIHARHSPYYLRRIRISNDDALAHYLRLAIPELVEDDTMAPNTCVVTIPQKSPDGAVVRESEGAAEFFDRIMRYQQNWILPGHRSGMNKHNVSATISVREKEWEPLGKLLWDRRYNYTGISLLPYQGGTYAQMPFEACSEEKYEEMSAKVSAIDLRDVKESTDNTSRMEQVACGNNGCEIM